MPRVCHFTGASTSSGWVCKYRGKAKYLGGVGIKTTSRKKRTFKPNLQDVTIVVDGAILMGSNPLINPRDVYFMAFLSPNQAMVQFGDRAPNGALMVHTRANGDKD